MKLVFCSKEKVFLLIFSLLCLPDNEILVLSYTVINEKSSSTNWDWLYLFHYAKIHVVAEISRSIQNSSFWLCSVTLNCFAVFFWFICKAGKLCYYAFNINSNYPSIYMFTLCNIFIFRSFIYIFNYNWANPKKCIKTFWFIQDKTSKQRTKTLNLVCIACFAYIILSNNCK